MDATQMQQRQAGEEMNAEVAARVMGWQLRPLLFGHWWFKGADRAAPANWSPSTDISAAWQVFVRYSEPAIMRIEDSGTPFWRCYLDADREVFADAETPELAICRAALLALDTPEP